MEFFFVAAPLNFCFSLFRWTGSGQFKQPSGSILWMAPEGMTSFFRLGFDVEVGRFRNFLMAFSTMDSEVTVYFLQFCGAKNISFGSGSWEPQIRIAAPTPISFIR